MTFDPRETERRERGAANRAALGRERKDPLSPDQQMFRALCAKHGLPRPEVEVRFHPDRKWRFDYAWPKQKVALEVEGGVWTGGRHTRGAGFVEDMEKYNAATRLGWRVLRVVPGELFKHATMELVAEVLTAKER